MKNKQHSLFLFFFLFICSSSFGQFFSSGEPPFSIKWKQINTNKFQIIYDEDYELKAQEFTKKLDYAYETIGYSLKHLPKRKLTIVLYNQNSVSNGLTTLAPSRVEMYTTPNQNMYGEDWLEQLLVHETRHFIQIDKINVGFTKILSTLFGDQGNALTLGLFITPWFLEGDAVVTETLLTKSGRGRNPNFEQGVRALTITDGKQKYDRALLGSYNYNIPNRYEFGYQIVATNRLLANQNVFESKLDEIGRSFSGFSFFSGKQHALRNRGPIKYYDQAFDYLQQKWKTQDSSLIKTRYTLITHDPKVYANYTQLTSNGKDLFARKNTFSQIPEFIKLDSSGNEQAIVQRGYNASYKISAAKDGTLVWDELHFDLRYDLRSFSEIILYDPSKKKVRTLKKNTRWFSPAILYNRILLVEADKDNNYRLKIVKKESGEELWSFQTPQNYYFQNPFWVDQHNIGVILNGNEGQSLITLNLDDKSISTIIPFTHNIISNPVSNNSNIYFTGSWTGINNIFKYNLKNNSLTQITSSRFGADFATILNSNLYYVDYATKGSRIVKFNDMEVQKINYIQEIPNIALNIQDSILNQEEKVLDFSKLKTQDFLSKNYSKWNLFRIHSWGISTINSDNDYGIQSGISIMSQNTLSTSIFTLGLNYNKANSDSKYYLNYSYRALWPIFDISLKGGDIKVYTNYIFNSPNGREINIVSNRINTYHLEGTITLPFNLSSGAWNRHFNLWGRVRNRWYDSYSNPGVNQSAINLKEIGYGASILNLQQTALRQLQPRWGQIIKFEYNKGFNLNLASIWGVESKIFFPGFIDNHGTMLNVAYERRHSVKARYSNIISIPRGYSSIGGESQLFFSGNYNLPLLYPDLSMCSFAYLKRLSSNIFFDASQVSRSKLKKYWLTSSGIEVLGDFNILRYEQPFKIGMRVGYINQGYNNIFTELLFSVQI